MSEKRENPSFLQRSARRVGTYGANRLMPAYNRDIASRTAKATLANVVDAIKPVRITREEALAGHHGRYTDGGRARFAEVMDANGVHEDDLPWIAAKHRKTCFILLVGSLAMFVLAMTLLFSGSSFLVRASSIASVIGALSLAAAAMRHDFYAWQIGQRAFPGFKPYLDSRFG